MDEYHAVVVSGDTSTRPRVISTDGSLVEILFPNSAIRLCFELAFDSTDDLDAFLASTRKKADARKCGGRIAMLTPMHLLEPSHEVLQDEPPSTHTLKAIAKLITVSEKDLRVAERIAWNAILDSYRRA